MNVWNHIELQELLQIHRYSVSIYSRMIVSIYMSSLVRGIYSMTECIIPSCRGCESSHRGTTCECVYHPCTIRKIIFQGKTRENIPVYPEIPLWIQWPSKTPNFVATNRQTRSKCPRTLSTKFKLGHTHMELSLCKIQIDTKSRPYLIKG